MWTKSVSFLDQYREVFKTHLTGRMNMQNTNRGKTPPGVDSANSTAAFLSNFLWTNVSGTINDVQQVASFLSCTIVS